MRNASNFWPYFTAVAITLLCAIRVMRDRNVFRHADRLSALALICYAIPMAVFGSEHLSSSMQIMKIVPPWMPGRLFWAYFVGLCLIAAALSVALGVRIRLSFILLGSMLFAFVAMIHLPNAFANPSTRVLWVVAARDLAFACGALVLGATQGKSTNRGQPPVEAMQLSVAAIVVFFGIEHFLHPECVPAVPLAKTIPPWMPLGLLWTYGTGIALLAGGVLMFTRRARRIAAFALGTLVLAIVLFFYIPIMIAQPNVESLNYVTDTLVFAGTLLAVASATPGPASVSSSLPESPATLSPTTSRSGGLESF